MGVQQGKQINITDYRETYSAAWRHAGDPYHEHIDGGTDRADWTKILYVSAPAFKVTIRGGNSFNATSTCYVDIYKWNGGSGFTTMVHSSFNASATWYGAWNYNKRSFSHNSEAADYEDTKSDTHLWKIEAHYVGSGLGGKDLLISIKTGGIEMVPQTSDYEFMWRRGSFLYASTGNYYTTSDYSTDTAFINAQKPSAYRGTPISVSTANFAYSEYPD